jgi:hypothetical protein
MQSYRLAGALLVITLPMIAFAQALPTVPTVVTADLNKREIIWPRDLTAERTVLIVGFAGNQQPVIDRWVAGLGLKNPGAPVWYEVPMIRNPGALGRWFINRGMRGGIPDSVDRSRVVTVYGDKQAMMRQMGLPDESVHALVVDRAGRILVRQSGEYTAQARAVVMGAMGR